MNKVQKRASVHEKTVQAVASGAIKQEKLSKKNALKPRRPRNSRVKIRRWSDGVDERIVAYILANKIHPSRIQVNSPTEVIIKNDSR